MKKAIIIAHGNKPHPSILKRYVNKGDLIVCADGGADYADFFGLIPDVVIGDNDSIAKNVQRKLKRHPTKWISYPKHPKYQTDAELAIDFVLQKKYRQILVFGIYGFRVDQSLATFLYIAQKQQFDGQFLIVENNQEIRVVSKKIRMWGEVGDVFSLIPLQKNATGVSIVGALYPLKKETIAYGSTLGISNEFKNQSVHLSLEKGTLLVIHHKK